jgi:hypothetical protein
MEMDMTGLWTWTLPLWGLGALVFFLATILSSPAEILTKIPGVEVITEIASAPAGNQGGGGWRRGKSRTH